MMESSDPFEPDCFKKPNTLGLVTAFIIMFGTIISYLPQYRIMIKNRSSEGVNTVTCGISLFSAYLVATNSGVLKWPLVTCCQELTTGECLLNNLATEQLIISVITVFLLYLLAMLYHPSITLVDYHTGSKLTRIVKSRRFNWALFAATNAIGILFSVVAGVLYYNLNQSSDTLARYAETLGWLSSIGMVLQWLPQIYTTWKNKSPGNLSVIMLLIQLPGALLVVYFQGIQMKAHYTTWFPYIFSAVQMLILIILIIAFQIRSKRLRKYAANGESQPLIEKADSEQPKST
eukprot:TRINITY_DN1682_c0_g1_i1.p1 TRINITY_DN1682_c0_g1~~TRINITY_DN1682_c0_g1_i1.p1  ORF type:complete len:290 (-),score=19.51 TRINITY_DN1682_c0_g1_i1:14-883(-)